MEKAVIVSIAVRSRHDHIADIGIGRPVHKRVIRHTRDHDIYFNSGFHRDHQRIQDRLIRDKIRCLDIDTFLCLIDQAQIIVMDLLGRLIRSTADDLHITEIPRTGFDPPEQFRAQKQVLSCRIIPV